LQPSWRSRRARVSSTDNLMIGDPSVVLSVIGASCAPVSTWIAM
jgi:hypothetical protein